MATAVVKEQRPLQKVCIVDLAYLCCFWLGKCKALQALWSRVWTGISVKVQMGRAKALMHMHSH